MTKSVEPFDPTFLINSDIMVRIYWDRVLTDSLGTSHATRRLRAMVRDPFLRPILELGENGATSWENGLLLKAQSFVQIQNMTVRYGELRDRCLEYLSLTEAANDYLERWSDLGSNSHEETEDAFSQMAEGVRAYLVIDQGNGIVVGRDVAEVAIDLEDPGILGRLVHLRDGSRQFILDPSAREVGERGWLEAEAYWSAETGAPRQGASILDLAGPLTRISVEPR